MPDIAHITLPSGNTYDIKDTVARQMISGGIGFNFCSNSANTPEGVQWTNAEGVLIIGTLAAADATPGRFYMVPSGTSGGQNVYSEYVAVGEDTKVWEMIGDSAVHINPSYVGVSKVANDGVCHTGSAAGFTQGTDTLTPNTPTTPASIDTSKFSGGSYTRGSFNGGDFVQGTDTFTATVSNETLTIGFAQGSDTFTPATHGDDSFTAAKLNSGFYTAGKKGSAASFTQGTDTFTPNTPTTVDFPTVTTETVVKSVN